MWSAEIAWTARTIPHRAITEATICQVRGFQVSDLRCGTPRSCWLSITESLLKSAIPTSHQIQAPTYVLGGRSSEVDGFGSRTRPCRSSVHFGQHDPGQWRLNLAPGKSMEAASSLFDNGRRIWGIFVLMKYCQKQLSTSAGTPSDVACAHPEISDLASELKMQRRCRRAHRM